MSNRSRRDNHGHSGTPEARDTLGEISTPQAQGQWVLNAVNNLRDDLRHTNDRIDTLHDKVGDSQTSSGRTADALERIEGLLKTQNDKLEALEQSISGAKNKVLGGFIVLTILGSAGVWLLGDKLKLILEALWKLAPGS